MLSSETFPALILRGDSPKSYTCTHETLSTNDLPAGKVRVAISHSGLNYKDALAVTGKGAIAKTLPLVPGVDFTGTVLESDDEAWHAGDEVILTGWGVGESHWGGYAGQARLSGDWLVKRPDNLSASNSMALGTAGVTAMQCVMALETAGINPESGPIVVTGAGGGVGGWAINLLSQLGFEVHAVSGRAELEPYLRQLGAHTVLDRETMSTPARPLEKRRWAGAVDTVGGSMLSRILAESDNQAVITACGLAGGFKLDTTVMPFILRGVRLQGINSVDIPTETRQEIWQGLADSVKQNVIDEITQTIGLNQVPEMAKELLVGNVRGRVVVAL